MIKQLLRNLLKIKIMQTTNRNSMERYAAKTEENTKELYSPGVTVLLNSAKGIECKRGYIYKIYVIKAATITAAGSEWNVQAVTGAPGATQTGMSTLTSDIALQANQEILGEFTKVTIATGGIVICYGAKGTIVEAA